MSWREKIKENEILEVCQRFKRDETFTYAIVQVMMYATRGNTSKAMYVSNLRKTEKILRSSSVAKTLAGKVGQNFALGEETLHPKLLTHGTTQTARIAYYLSHLKASFFAYQ